MKERPLLFSAPMVRALLDGTKTQTRRLVKPQPHSDWSPRVERYHPTVINKRTGEEEPGPEIFGATDEDCGRKAPCEPGDRIWVKEAIERSHECVDPHSGRAWTASAFVADGLRTKADAWPWTRDKLPGMFMPRGLSRITLEVTGVRVERLQDISASDAIAEGVARGEYGWHDYTDRYENDSCNRSDPRVSYRSLWESINGAGSWGSTWVWVISFKRVKP